MKEDKVMAIDFLSQNIRKINTILKGNISDRYKEELLTERKVYQLALECIKLEFDYE